MSNFGKTQLLKYGWTEGKGLGKDENGIAEALKPKLKFDTTGIGHKDSDFQWWSSIYDKALKNVVSENSDEKVSIKVKKENAFNISSTQSGLEVSEEKISLHYGKFLKTSTLKDGSLIRHNNCAVIKEDKQADVSFTQITDEELFKACGGRTAHKGARHGLKLSGKLARIAAQERELLDSNFLKPTEISLNRCGKSKKKKEKRKKMVIHSDDATLNTTTDNISDNENSIRPVIIPHDITDGHKMSKKSIKKLKRKVNDLSHQLTKSLLLEKDDPCTNVNEVKEESTDKPSKKSIKKLKRKVNELSDQLSKSCLLEEITVENQYNFEDQCDKESQKVKKKNKKKNKRKLDEYDIYNDINNIRLDNDIAEPCAKKSKKHRQESSKSSKIDSFNEKSIETKTDRESGKSKCSFCIWRNGEIKSKKLKKYEKKERKKKNKIVS